MEVSNSILSGDEYLGQPEEVVRQYIRKISISMTVYKKNININVTCCVVPFKIGSRLRLKIVADTTEMLHVFF